MATATISTFLPVLLTALVCQGRDLGPDLVAENATSKAALDASRVTVVVTYRRNQMGHLVAQVQLDSGNDQAQSSSDKIETAPVPGAPVRDTASRVGQLSGVKRYSIYTTGRNWDQARRICDQDGGYLAVINSEAELGVLQGLFELAPTATGVDTTRWAFVGLHDRFVEGEWLTIQGKPLESTGFTLWNSGEPNNLNGDENCGSLTRNGALNDKCCSSTLAFFCEQEN